MSERITTRAFFDPQTWTVTYVVWDPATRHAAVIDPVLDYDVKDKAEQTGRAQLFSAAFMAYRNPRAHRELDHDYVSLHTEFLMLNHLFALERQAVHRTAPP